MKVCFNFITQFNPISNTFLNRWNPTRCPNFLIFTEESKLCLDFKTTQKLMDKTLKYYIQWLIVFETDTDFDKQLDINQKSSGCKQTDESLEQRVEEIFHLIGHKSDWKLFESIDFSTKASKRRTGRLSTLQMNVSKSQIPNQLFIDLINKQIRSFVANKWVFN